MIDKNFDLAIIGHNYISLLGALLHKKNKHNVVVLDIPSEGMGELHLQAITEFEKEFIEELGKSNEFNSALNVSKYLTLSQRIFQFNHKKVFLGGNSPSLNLLEIYRKLPFLFNKENHKAIYELVSNKEQRDNFDKAYFSFVKRMGQSSVRYHKAESLGIDIFFTHAPQIIKDIFESLCLEENVLSGKDFWDFKSFYYLTSSLFQQRVSFSSSKIENFYLLLCFISPFYTLNHKQFCSDLLHEFIDMDGQYKKANLNEWHFDKGNPWALELDSFEGVIHPKKIYYAISCPKKIPLFIGNSNPYYDVYRIRFRHKTDETFIDFDKYKYFSISNSIQMGTDIPIWCSHYIGDNTFDFYIKIKHRDCSKKDFYEKLIIDFLKEELPINLFIKFEDLEFIEMEETNNIVVDKISGHYKSDDDFPISRKLIFKNTNDPSQLSTIKNVDYFGPFKESAMGRLSSLVELKDLCHFS